jgi:hypothetical protein
MTSAFSTLLQLAFVGLLEIDEDEASYFSLFLRNA